MSVKQQKIDVFYIGSGMKSPSIVDYVIYQKFSAANNLLHRYNFMYLQTSYKQVNKRMAVLSCIYEQVRKVRAGACCSNFSDFQTPRTKILHIFQTNLYLYSSSLFVFVKKSNLFVLLVAHVQGPCTMLCSSCIFVVFRVFLARTRPAAVNL